MREPGQFFVNGVTPMTGTRTKASTLTRGDRRDFVIVVREGDHALSQRITSATGGGA
jgi:hypothetical protein